MDPQQREEFIRAAKELARLIPPGRATTYGAIARAAGRPTLPRMIGRILSGADCTEEGIPAHRVVGNGGRLTAAAAFGEPGRMERLLEAEGVVVANGRILGWKKVFWDPLKEL